MSIPDTHKRQHLLECLNVVDAGTPSPSIFACTPDFNAQSVIEALVSAFSDMGCRSPSR
ncbi:MAG: hypothetical protein KF716_05135 [Anaerolineae bacterium]|nr:hypothetical protein [Anaerolineae bacterium]